MSLKRLRDGGVTTLPVLNHEIKLTKKINYTCFCTLLHRHTSRLGSTASQIHSQVVSAE